MRQSRDAPVAEVVDGFGGAICVEAARAHFAPQHRQHLGIEQLRRKQIRVREESLYANSDR